MFRSESLLGNTKLGVAISYEFRCEKPQADFLKETFEAAYFGAILASIKRFALKKKPLGPYFAHT